MSDEVKKFLDEYCDFVTKVTSEPSLDQDALIKRMKEIDSESDIHSARLLTAALGLGSEGGEFVEIVKKMFWMAFAMTIFGRYIALFIESSTLQIIIAIENRKYDMKQTM